MANSPCNFPLQTQNLAPPIKPCDVLQRWCHHSALLPLQHPIGACPDYTRASFFLHKKIPASQKVRVGTSTVSLARGANREVKKRVKGKASHVQSTRIGSTLVCVRRNVQHRELKLSKSTRFALVTVVMVAVPIGCVVSPPPLFSQNLQAHKKFPTSHRAQGVPPNVSLAPGANRKGKGRVKGKASRIQSSRIGSALVCIRRNAQYPELKLPESTRFVLNTVLMVAVSTRRPTGASPPPLSSQHLELKLLEST